MHLLQDDDHAILVITDTLIVSHIGFIDFSQLFDKLVDFDNRLKFSIWVAYFSFNGVTLVDKVLIFELSLLQALAHSLVCLQGCSCVPKRRLFLTNLGLLFGYE